MGRERSAPERLRMRAMSEHRIHPRIRSLIGGRIEFNNRQSTMDCIIRELSEGGAKLEISQSITLPEEFDLLIPKRNQSHHVRICWRHEDFIGVEFVTPGSLGPKTTDYPGLVKHLEAENASLRRQLEELRAERSRGAA
jgi:hypothetical protein